MDLTSGVSWFRGSSVRIRRGGREIHVDPSGLTEEGPADYVLLTHPHYDNFSEENIARVRGAGTTVIAPASMKKQLADADHFRNLSTTMGHSTGLIREQFPVWRGVWWED